MRSFFIVDNLSVGAHSYGETAFRYISSTVFCRGFSRIEPYSVLIHREVERVFYPRQDGSYGAVLPYLMPGRGCCPRNLLDAVAREDA